MYNRYIHNDRSEHVHSPVQNSPPTPLPPQGHSHFEQHHEDPRGNNQSHHCHTQESTSPSGGRDKKGILSSLLGKLKLDDIDTGDLLLIAMIVLLFKEGEDEELLIALVLLLIL